MASIIKRNVILTPAEYDGVANQKGIVTFEILGNQASGFLRCYNLEQKENLVFGVKINEQMHKFKLNKGYDYLTFSLGNINNLQFAKISCMLVKVGANNTSTLLIGSTETTSLYSNEILNFLNDNNLENDQLLENKLERQRDLDKHNFSNHDFNNNEKFNIDKPLKFPSQNKDEDLLKMVQNKNLNSHKINANNKTENEEVLEHSFNTELNNYIDDLTCEPQPNNNCKNCMYKNYFYCKNSESQIGEGGNNLAQNLALNKTKNNNENQEKQEDFTIINTEKNSLKNCNSVNEKIKNQTTFYDSLSGQINTLINSNIHEEVLEEILPNSTFVRIDKENGSYMVLGVINNEQGEPEYLCYGHPAKNINDTPFNFDNHFSYFPVNIDDPQGKGYYLSYQSAQNGENVKVTLI